MEYWDSFSDDLGCIHSIDMVYVEYFSYLSAKNILEIIRSVKMDFPDLKYVEFLNRLPCSKYDYYIDSVSIGGVYVEMGKYKNYDKLTKTFDLLDMFQIRLNPNKCMNKPFCSFLLNKLLAVSTSGYLRKYDYAIDIKVSINGLQLFDCKKEPGLFKGTRYFGQSGRHGYIKIYDKRKELTSRKKDYETGKFIITDNLGYDLTRLEYTFLTRDSVSLDNTYILSSNTLNNDYSALNDTEVAIVEMYLQLKALNSNYDLKLGRKMNAKLKEYISGQYVLLDYKNILFDLLETVKTVFKASDIITDSVEYMQDSECDDLPFD